MLAEIRKALVPVVATVVALGLKAIGVDLGIDTDTTIAAGIVTTAFTYLVPNG